MIQRLILIKFYPYRGLKIESWKHTREFTILHTWGELQKYEREKSAEILFRKKIILLDVFDPTKKYFFLNTRNSNVGKGKKDKSVGSITE